MFSDAKITVGYRCDRFSLKMTVTIFEYLTVGFLKFEFSNYIFYIIFHLCTITKWYNHQIITDWHRTSDFIIHDYIMFLSPIHGYVSIYYVLINDDEHEPNGCVYWNVYVMTASRTQVIGWDIEPNLHTDVSKWWYIC